MVYEQGLVTEDGRVLALPGQVGISAGVAFDPVTTYVSGNMAMAPNTENVIVIQAQVEFRYLFKGADLSDVAGIQTLEFLGNHCDIGGGYDNGLAGLTLTAGTQFLQLSGLSIADVSADRLPDFTTLNVHTEEGVILDNSGNVIGRKWDVSDYFNTDAESQAARLLANVATPGEIIYGSDSITENFTLYNGNKISITTTSEILTISNYDPSADGIGMMNTFDLTTGNLIGQASTSDATVYSNMSTGIDLSSYLDRIETFTTYDDNYILATTGIRTLTGTQAVGESWGGNILLDSYTNNISWWQNGLDHTQWQNTTTDYTTWDGSDWFYAGSNYLFSNTSEFGMFNTFDLGSLDLGGSSYTDYYYQNIDTSLWSDSEIGMFNTFSMTTGNSYADYSFNYYDYTYTDYSYDYSYDYYDYSYTYYYTPVALDLDGDGIELIAQSDSKAYFDVKGTGYRNHIGWVGPDDGFLAIDINHDDKISDSKELSFALWTDNPDDTDLEGLKAVFDTNQNGKLDNGDTQYADFRIWQDANGDGITDDGELKTLTEAGIQSVRCSI